MSVYIANSEDFTKLANKIRAKGKTSAQLSFPDGMGAAVDAIKSKSAYTWHQCHQAVRDYLDNVAYNPSDYTTSQIANYAPSSAVQSNTKPIGKTIDGVTYYNEVPNVDKPFSSANEAGTVKPLDRLRWINTSATPNVRDIGGWSCDGGTIKYGMLFRGGWISTDDKTLMVDDLGIRHDIDLRGVDIEFTESPLGKEVYYTRAPHSQMYVIDNYDVWRTNIGAVFNAVKHEEPAYIHCQIGTDRTGTIYCILEGLLGVSQSDIDKDYELSNFYTGSGNDATARRRNEADWISLINAIKAVPLVGGLTDTFRNRVVSFVLSLGFTITEINDFRSAMIDGNPTAITVNTGSYTVTKNGSNVAFSNNLSSVDEFQGYEVEVEPTAGYVITDVVVTVDGVDVSGAYFDGVFTPNGYKPITNNGEFDVRNYNMANVSVPASAVTSGSLNVTSNGTYDVTDKKSVVVNVPAPSVTKYSVTKTLHDSTSNNSKTQVTSDEGYGAVIAPNSGYGISGISVTMGGTDITASCVTLIEGE